MEIITGFDSGVVTEKKMSQLPEGEYLKMLQALRHNQEVAENVFARTAKTQFRGLVDHKVKRIRGDELKGGRAQWFSQTSMAADLAKLRCYSLEVVSGKIAEMVHDFGQYILGTIGEDKVLLDSLSTSIIRSGDDVYQFRIKQKWADNG